MKILNYLGAEGDCIIIQQPTDIYPLLDWCQSQMMDEQEKAKSSINIDKWEKGIKYLSKLMEQVEKEGMGGQEDIDNIEY
jgi:hypothetical protein